MVRRLRLGVIARVVLLLLVAAVLVDRIALYAWGTAVLRQFQRYRESVSPSGGSQRYVSITDATEPPLWMATVTSSRPGPATLGGDHRDLFLSLEPGVARPDFIDLRGGVLQLLFLPPPLAWTTRIFPLRPHGLQYRMYRPKDYYAYRIDADLRSGVQPAFKLYRVVHFEAHELPATSRYPELFP